MSQPLSRERAPKTPPAPHDLRPRGWVKVVLFLLVCGLAIGTWNRLSTERPTALSSDSPPDAVVECRTTDVAPELVTGRLLRVALAENDRVAAGQVVAELDPAPYQQQVDLAKARLATAEADAKRQDATLARLKLELPLQLAIAEQTLAGARAEKAKADETLKLTEIEVERAAVEARVQVDAARIVREFAKKDFDRFAALSPEDAAPIRRSQEAAKALATADANLKLATTKLITAEAEQAKLAVARRGVEEAEAGVKKAAKAQELAAVAGKDGLAETELAAAARHLAVEDAKQTLAVAETALSFTKIRAPFAGVVLRRLRNPGDLASPGSPVASVYNPDAFFVTLHRKESQLTGVNPGNAARLEIATFANPFRGRVLSVNRGETVDPSKSSRRVSVRVLLDQDDRSPQLRPGLPATATLEPGKGDPKWAEQAVRALDASKP